MGSETAFEEDCKSFELALPELLKEHHGKWVIWRNGKVFAMRDTCDEAYQLARETFGLIPVVVACVAHEHEHSMKLGLSWKTATNRAEEN